MDGTLQRTRPPVPSDSFAPAIDEISLERALANVGQPFAVRLSDGAILPVNDQGYDSTGSLHVPACHLENLGDPGFRADHGLRYAYVAGAMANGIGSADIAE